MLINNASVFEYDFPGEGCLEVLAKSLAIHAVVPFALIESFAEVASSERRLDVFNILDQKLLAINPDYMSYTIGKAALKAITDLWQASYSDRVRVFGIMPGNMYASGPQSDADLARSGRTNLLKRLPRPVDVCDAITFFVSNGGLPSQNIAIDAGEHLTGRKRDPAFE